MSDTLFSPIKDKREVQSLLRELPLAVNEEHFLNFVLGFPRKYLVGTPRVEIVKHYFLVESLKDKSVISSLSQEKDAWKLSLVTRDRRFLFSRISGSLSCFGMNILEAQAFANASSLVLDTFHFADPTGYFLSETSRRNFLYFLEDVLEGNKDLESELRLRITELIPPEMESFTVKINNSIHPSASLLTLDCRDHLGLLYLVSRCISEEGCDIEIAYVQTPGQRVHDEFYLTYEGEKLPSSIQENLKSRLRLLGEGQVEASEHTPELSKGL